MTHRAKPWLQIFGITMGIYVVEAGIFKQELFLISGEEEK